jgi:hypothetical protein
VQPGVKAASGGAQNPPVAVVSLPVSPLSVPQNHAYTKRGTSKKYYSTAHKENKRAFTIKMIFHKNFTFPHKSVRACFAGVHPRRMLPSCL